MRLFTMACEFGASGTLAGSGVFHGPAAENPLSGCVVSPWTAALDPCGDRPIASTTPTLTIQRAERTDPRTAMSLRYHSSSLPELSEFIAARARSCPDAAGRSPARF